MSFLQIVRYARLTDRTSQIPNWHPRQIERVQQSRLHQLLRHASNHSPFYREKFRGLNLKYADLSSLPVTTKDELRDNFDSVVTVPGLTREVVDDFVADENNLGRWLQGRYAISHTSGSQGPPLPIVQDRKALEILFAIMSSRATTNRRPGIVEAVRRLIEPKRIAVIAFRRGFYPSGASLEFMQEIVGPFVRILRLSSLQPDLIDRLNEFQPHVVTGYASVLEALALQKNKIHWPQLQQITNSSEQLHDRARQRIKQAFQVPVIDHYGIGECLWLADGCLSSTGLHINADWAIVEVVNENLRPVPPGQLGAKVLVTNLANRVQPFIRYVVEDRAVLATSPCTCGSHLPRLERIVGRSAEVFWVHDGQQPRLVSGVLLHSAMDSLGVLREWQAIHYGENQIEMRIELMPAAHLTADEAQQLLERKLVEYGLPSNVELLVRIVPTIAADLATGKIRRLINRIAPGESIKSRFDDIPIPVES